MLETWGGDGGDTITQEEFERVGYDEAKKYHDEYCWYHGFGYCDNCALDKHFKAEGCVEVSNHELVQEELSQAKALGAEGEEG